MNIEFYLKNTDDRIVSRNEEKVETEFGNVFYLKDGEIIKAIWKTKFETMEIDNPSFSKYYLESYSENMLRK